MAHEFAGALQQASRIRQRGAVEEPHVYVRGENIDVAERRISQTGNRTAVMQKLPDFVPAFSHHLKPVMLDGGIPFDRAVEPQEFRSHRRSLSAFEICGYVARLPSLEQSPRPEQSFLSKECRSRLP